MLYGEGKKVFHRLQLEIICWSNDQSIFAWGRDSRDTENVRIGSLLADDFEECYRMKTNGLRRAHQIIPTTDADHFQDVLPNVLPNLDVLT